MTLSARHTNIVCRQITISKYSSSIIIIFVRKTCVYSYQESHYSLNTYETNEKNTLIKYLNCGYYCENVMLI